MKILHTVGGFTLSGGGITSCLADLLRGLDAIAGADDAVKLLTVDSYSEPLVGNGEGWLQTVPNDYRTPLALSKNLKRALAETDADLFHTNGLWMHVNHITAKEAHRRCVPFVLSPHGMLFEQALKRSRWKKWPLKRIWFDKDIKHASAIHVTSEEEAQQVRQYGYKGRIELIPNPVAIPNYIPDVLVNKEQSDVPIFGFLGRLHPRKGVEVLIDAFSAAKYARGKDARLMIMGTGDAVYEAELRDRAHQKGVADVTEFVGQVSGREKFERLAMLSALVVPSDFENFGMIVPEALSVETPVVASLNTPWEMLQTEKAGWWTSRDTPVLSDVMNQIAEMSTSELRDMGHRGAKIVKEKFDVSVVAREMWKLYKSL